MGNTHKIIPFAIGLIVTIALIGVVLGVYNYSKKISDKASGQLSELVDTYSSEYNNYDGKTVTGLEVLELIEKSDRSFEIIVHTGYAHEATLENKTVMSNGKTVTLPFTTGTRYAAGSTETTNAKNSNNAAYIKPEAGFTGTLYWDVSHTSITAIAFVRQ